MRFENYCSWVHLVQVRPQHCLNEVDKYLKQTDPDKIGYFSFTQKAAHEARDRAMSKI